VLELDIESFFDTLDHGTLRELVKRRVRDGVITRLIGKWLKAGVMEEGELRRNRRGTPQGGVISPLLANVYLHYALDSWFEDEVRDRLLGRAFMVRFADDAVLCFSNEQDAKQVLEALRQRFEEYGLTLHPEKTRLVHYRPPGGTRGETESFDFLGFTHYWAKSRKGSWVIKRKTAKDRHQRFIAGIRVWCRCNRHRPVKEQLKTLSRKLLGHYNYYGLSGNSRMVRKTRYLVEKTWLKWLGRRSQRARLGAKAKSRLLSRFVLPSPVIRPVANPC
jgi:group II intron reverse transcriptase/maturase